MKQQTIVDGIRVASPCSENWDDMKGDGVRRNCQSCGHEVYNISAMTTAEVLVLMGRSDELPCVRFYRRDDGTVMTADCPIGLQATRRYRARLLAWVLAPVAAIAAAFGLRQIIEHREPEIFGNPQTMIPPPVLGKIQIPSTTFDVSVSPPATPPNTGSIPGGM